MERIILYGAYACGEFNLESGKWSGVVYDDTSIIYLFGIITGLTLTMIEAANYPKDWNAQYFSGMLGEYVINNRTYDESTVFIGNRKKYSGIERE